MSTTLPLDRGVMMISLDFELIWGTMDRAGVSRFASACQRERDVVIDRLLDLFTRNGVSATWCILGHLFLDNCQVDGGRKHPEIVRPNHAWFPGDWFENDPASSEKDAPIFYGRSLVRKIMAAGVPQEIGCHSFSHVIFGDEGCSRAVAESELRACLEAAKSTSVELRSFAFPRNRVGHRSALKQHGFIAYRGPEPSWFGSLPRPLARAMHLLEVVAAKEPPVVVPRLDDEGLWDIPGSMIYFPMHGVRALIPVSWRVKRAIKGLDAAVANRKIFHLWFHPTNLAEHMDAMFKGLEEIILYAKALEREGRLEIASMGDIADRSQRSSAA